MLEGEGKRRMVSGVMQNLTYVGTGSSVLLSVCDGRFRAVLSLSKPGHFTLYGPMLCEPPVSAYSKNNLAWAGHFTLYGPMFCEYGRAADFAAAEARAVAWLKEEAVNYLKAVAAMEVSS